MPLGVAHHNMPPKSVNARVRMFQLFMCKGQNMNFSYLFMYNHTSVVLDYMVDSIGGFVLPLKIAACVHHRQV